ncbi:MAG: DUF5343 domain-containing protein [Parvibaculaceae bacterium]
MLTSKYMVSRKNIGDILESIKKGAPPPKFSVDHLKGLGFKSSNDRAIIGLLKDLGFLTADGSPTDRYHAYRDKSKSARVLADALRDAYEDIFQINESPSDRDRDAIEGKFKTVHGSTDRTAKEQAATFLALLKFADFSTAPEKSPEQSEGEEKESSTTLQEGREEYPNHEQSLGLNLRYNVEIHLPASKDPDVYAAIFRSIKEHLLQR